MILTANSEDEHDDEITGDVDADNSSPEDEDEGEESEVELVAQENSCREDEDGEETSQLESVAPENRADEVDPLPTTRSRSTYKPYDWAKLFPETAHTQYSTFVLYLLSQTHLRKKDNSRNLIRPLDNAIKNYY